MSTVVPNRTDVQSRGNKPPKDRPGAAPIAYVNSLTFGRFG